jgi:DNA-binding FadR family transcriptional regulator
VSTLHQDANGRAADLLAERIRHQIATGELREGDWLPTEAELIERYGVSRPTLREAIRLLEADSLIRVRQGRPGGAQVSIPGPAAAAPLFGLVLTMTGTTLADVYEARLTIEPAAARRLAGQGTEADHDALAAEIDRVATSTGTTLPFGAATVAFHRRLVELAGNQTLATIITMLGTITSRHVEAAYRESPRSTDETATDNRRAVRSYRRLLTLVRARDGEGAERHWAAHMRAARDAMTRDTGLNDRQVIELLS